jgi:hypothetical protein
LLAQPFLIFTQFLVLDYPFLRFISACSQGCLRIIGDTVFCESISGGIGSAKFLPLFFSPSLLLCYLTLDQLNRMLVWKAGKVETIWPAMIATFRPEPQSRELAALYGIE